MTAATPVDAPLSPKEELFVSYYLADPELRAAVAYARAFGKRGPEARRAAGALLKTNRVRDRIRMAQASRRVALSLEGTNVIRELAAIIAADPRDLIEYRRGACRYCHGAGHRFQRTPAEFERDVDKYREQQTTLASMGRPADTAGLAFKVEGGIGFNPNAHPHPDCPECHGHGVGYTYAKDSRNLTPAAARLYAGVKETRDGLEIKLRSVDKAVELAMKHLGLLDDKGNARTPEEMAAAVRELVDALGATKPAQ